MNRRRQQVAELASRVTRERQQVEAAQSPWLVPAVAFATGLLLPVVTGKSAANPITQLTAFGRKLVVRAFRFAVFRRVIELLQPGTSPMPSTDDGSAQ